MDEFVTVKTFSYPHEVLVVQSILEGEGIETYVKDELTVQMNPLYSNAIGGIKLQVGRDDAERALQILADTGHLVPEEFYTPELKIFQKVIDWIKANKWKLILIPVIILAITYIASRSSPVESLESNYWQIKSLRVNNKEFVFQNDKIESPTYLDERRIPQLISLDKSGTVWIDAFNNTSIHGKWELLNDSITFLDFDTFQSVFQGHYSIEFSWGSYKLISNSTTIDLDKLFSK